MANIAEHLAKDLVHRIKTDQIVLPTLPEVALRVREAAEDENATASSLSQVIGTDAAISARIVKVANSPLMRGMRTVEDLQMAISRLGISYTCNLATGLAMEQMYQATSDYIDTRMRDVWNRSTEVAAISAVLARHYTKLAADQAMLAGLTYQIGILPILTYAEEHDELLNHEVMLDKIIDKLHGTIGGLILRTWEFPKELSCVPSFYTQHQRQHNAVDYSDIVTVAHLQSRLTLDGLEPSQDWSHIVAFSMLGLDPEVDMQEGEDLSEEMALTAKALN